MARTNTNQGGGGGGLTFVTHDTSLFGDGTAGSPLGVAASAKGFTYINEIVAGSGTAFTLAHVPADSARVCLYGGGSRLTPGIGNDYTIVGAVITMTNSYASGQVLADYS